jgi:hypothetical protein
MNIDAAIAPLADIRGHRYVTCFCLCNQGVLMKLSSKLQRLIEIKIRRSLASESYRFETQSVPEPASQSKPQGPDGSARR